MFDVVMIVVEQVLLHLPLIFGGFISIALMKLPDLSLESSYLFGAMASATIVSLLPIGMPLAFSLALALATAMLAGMAVGIAMSVITITYKIPHLLGSIIVLGLFYGLSIVIGSSYISLTGHPNTLLIMPYFPRHPEIIALLAISTAIVVGMAYLLRSQLGFALQILGNNPAMFGYISASKPFVTMCGLLISSSLAGLSGFLMVQSNGFAEITMATGKVLLCLTALILGTVVMRSKRTLFIPMSGVAIYFFIQHIVLKVGLSANYFMALQSIIVLGVLMVTYAGSEHKNIDHLGV